VEQVVSIVVENEIFEEIVVIQPEEKGGSPMQVAPEAIQSAKKSEGQAASPAGEGLAADIQIDDDVQEENQLRLSQPKNANASQSAPAVEEVHE
jgi:hypothetical protein